MADPTDSVERETISPSDMRDWLMQEIRDVTKATELRIKDATDFVMAYSVGEIDSKEVERRKALYEGRWGDAIYGLHAWETQSNETILQRLDDHIREEEVRATRRLNREPQSRMR
jgi:hypothetical protein